MRLSPAHWLPLLFCSTLVAQGAIGKPWQGITPGASTDLEVLGKFGEPSKTVTSQGVQTLIYSREVAIKGTVQAQFKLNAEKVVVRIDVFPAVALDAAAIERGYGPVCAVGHATEPCYAEKRTPTKARYFVYAKLGLAVFFNDDAKTVKLLAFLPAT